MNWRQRLAQAWPIILAIAGTLLSVYTGRGHRSWIWRLLGLLLVLIAGIAIGRTVHLPSWHLPWFTSETAAVVQPTPPSATAIIAASTVQSTPQPTKAVPTAPAATATPLPTSTPIPASATPVPTSTATATATATATLTPTLTPTTAPKCGLYVVTYVPFIDQNDNGIFEPGEMFVPDVEVRTYESGKLVATTVTKVLVPGQGLEAVALENGKNYTILFVVPRGLMKGSKYTSEVKLTECTQTKYIPLLTLATVTATVTASATAFPTATATAMLTPTSTATRTPTSTPSATATQIPSLTPTTAVQMLVETRTPAPATPTVPHPVTVTPPTGVAPVRTTIAPAASPPMFLPTTGEGIWERVIIIIDRITRRITR